MGEKAFDGIDGRRLFDDDDRPNVSFGNIFDISNLTAQNDDERSWGPIPNQGDEFPTRHEREAKIDERRFNGISFDQSERPFRGVRDGRPKFMFGQATIEKRGVVGVVLDNEDVTLQSFVLGLTPEPRTEFEQPLNSHLDDFQVVCMVRASNPKESSRKKRLTRVRTLSESFDGHEMEIHRRSFNPVHNRCSVRLRKAEAVG